MKVTLPVLDVWFGQLFLTLGWLSPSYCAGSLGFAHELKKASCRTKIIMLTMHNDPDLISAALDREF
jgi:DNA-binding NarL/FixJ family response regulator